MVTGEYGNTKHWYFCCTRAFYSPTPPPHPTGTERSALDDIALLSAEVSSSSSAESSAHILAAGQKEKFNFDLIEEKVSEKLVDKLAIEINHFHKIFKTQSNITQNRNDNNKKNNNKDQDDNNDINTAGLSTAGEGESGEVGEADEIVALDDVSLSMYQGQILALLGHNGAGKSTLISLLTGLYRPTAGSAKVYGRDLVENIDDIRLSYGVCPQHDVLFEQLTVREHLEFYAALKGVPEAQVADIIIDKLEELQMLEKIDCLATELSGGQKRKLCVIIALIGDNKVVFLDEPTSGLDPYSRRLIWQVLKKHKEGRVIILTTHFMDEADLLGDRIAILSKGKLRAIGSSLFLKNRFGTGYHLDLLFQTPHAPSSSSSSPPALSAADEAKKRNNNHRDLKSQNHVDSDPSLDVVGSDNIRERVFEKIIEYIPAAIKVIVYIYLFIFYFYFNNHHLINFSDNLLIKPSAL